MLNVPRFSFIKRAQKKTSSAIYCHPFLHLRVMEMKSSTVITVSFLCLLLFNKAQYFSKGAGSDESDAGIVYEIDYRGPETHSSVPPPHHSHGTASLHGQEGTVAAEDQGAQRGDKH